MKALTTLFLLLSVTVVACSTQYQASLPPGVDRGMLWGTEYGYKDVYSTPDVMPMAKKGSRKLLSTLNTALKKAPCTNKERLIVTLIINEEGDISEVLPHKPTGEKCEAVVVDTLKDIKFHPAIYQKEAVKSVFSISGYMP
ncbi:MAG: hypothetical protein WD016_10030 [Balneolaceae bacterium]